jgi:hypothetical protein
MTDEKIKQENICKNAVMHKGLLSHLSNDDSSQIFKGLAYKV